MFFLYNCICSCVVLLVAGRPIDRSSACHLAAASPACLGRSVHGVAGGPKSAEDDGRVHESMSTSRW
ncbi:hypothetical protein PF008_g18577 [Phytophthora fragariae]|nr:hypothetical protein PF003_g17597 [Phytophthora fragariae]KAE9318113.1 hypothetical protein PF008_g18577 [Phytophthora fragariae]